MRLLMLGLMWLLALARPAAAFDESDLLPVDEAFALTQSVDSEGNPVFHWAIADGYYLYRHQFKLSPVSPQDFALDSLLIPPGTPKHDQYFGDTETFRGEVKITALGRGAGPVDFKVRYQGCADAGVCYPPQTRVVTVELADAPVGATGALGSPLGLPGTGSSLGASSPLLGNASAPLGTVEATPLPDEQAFVAEAIADSPSVLLLRFTPAPGYYLYRDRTHVRLLQGDDVQLHAPQWPPAQSHHDDHFGDVAVYFEQVEVPLPLARQSREAQTLQLEIEMQGCQTDGICYPPMKRSISVALPALAKDAPLDAAIAAAAAGSAATGALAAILLALLGGLILNLMPCVLPVLSLKVLGVAGSGESAEKARRHALWYTAGVLVSFAVVGMVALGLRSAGLALGWGFQLQQPLMVAMLALLIFVVGLSLSGLFQIGAGMAGMGQSLAEKQGAAGDFFTGVLAVVVATPCTAPFMGSALAFAFAAPTALALAVFLALGLGLALPFLLIGFVPGLARLLPRPGVWMDTLKQALAFPMYLTAVWLVWVLAKQRGADAVGWVLIAAVAFGAAAWAWSHWQIRRPHWALPFALAGVVGGVVALGFLHHLPVAQAGASQAQEGVVAYSEKSLADLRREGRVVFVNMTADWCVTCKANEKTVLSTDAFKQALKETDAVYMKGDWTNVDPEITRFLEVHGAVGVPLYVVFPKGGGEGEVLPTVLSESIATEALSRAAR